jgi:hypothetical protein
VNDIEIEGLGSSRLTLVRDREIVFVMASMEYDRAEGGRVVAVCALDSAALAQLREFVKEVNE